LTYSPRYKYDPDYGHAPDVKIDYFGLAEMKNEDIGLGWDYHDID